MTEHAHEHEPKFHRKSVRVSTRKPIEEKTVEPYWRPTNRMQCYDHALVPRPCPFVGCKYNLFLDVDENSGSLILVHGTDDPTKIGKKCSCVLDVIEETGYSGLTLEEVGALLSLTRERIRQIERDGLAWLRLAREELEDFTHD